MLSPVDSVVTPDHSRFFQEITDYIKAHSDVFRAAGRWLDAEYSVEACRKREATKLRKKRDVEREIQGRPQRSPAGSRRSKTPRSMRFSLVNRFLQAVSDCSNLMHQKHRLSSEEAARVLLLIWLMTDPDADKSGAILTDFQHWQWEAMTFGSDERRYGRRVAHNRIFEDDSNAQDWIALAQEAWKEKPKPADPVLTLANAVHEVWQKGQALATLCNIKQMDHDVGIIYTLAQLRAWDQELKADGRRFDMHIEIVLQAIPGVDPMIRPLLGAKPGQWTSDLKEKLLRLKELVNGRFYQIPPGPKGDGTRQLLTEIFDLQKQLRCLDVSAGQPNGNQAINGALQSRDVRFDWPEAMPVQSLHEMPEKQKPFRELKGLEKRIVKTMVSYKIYRQDNSEERWTGKKIATQIKPKISPHSGNYKRTLKSLKDEGVLYNPGKGYCLTVSAYEHFKPLLLPPTPVLKRLQAKNI